MPRSGTLANTSARSRKRIRSRLQCLNQTHRLRYVAPTVPIENHTYFSQITQTSTSISLTTTTPVTTSTITFTASQTVILPSATVYAACSSANLVGNVDGAGINQYYGDAASYTTNDGSAYDCCVACINNPLCPASGFYGRFRAGSQCYISVASGTCSAEGQYQYSVERSSDIAPNGGYIVSNGNCAFYTSAK